MNKIMGMFFSVLFIAILFITGCAKPPAEDIDAAKNAVESAKSAGAVKYLPDDAGKVNDELTAALDEVSIQDGKFALFRKYDKAKEILALVKNNAEKLKTDTIAKKEEAKKNAETAIGEAKGAIDNAKSMLEKAPAGKETKADIEAMKGDIQGLESSLPEVQNAINSEDYDSAASKAKSIKEKADAVSSQVQQAIEKVEAAKKAKGKKKGKK